jgi:hypothetical protein
MKHRINESLIVMLDLKLFQLSIKLMLNGYFALKM